MVTLSQSFVAKMLWLHDFLRQQSGTPAMLGKLPVLRPAAFSFMALFMLSVSQPVLADTLLEEVVDFQGTLFFIEAGVPGVVIGAVRDGEIVVRGYGETSKGNGVTPDGDTIMRVGSITKVFAGEMLALAAANDEAGFTDPVAPYLSGRLGAAAAGRSPMRLIDLVTHSAGLPREVTHPGGPETDPFSTITTDAFADWLEAEDLIYAPGSAIAYSNFGFDLLAAALSAAADTPYPALLTERITAPLGMNDTGFAVPESARPRVMFGHGIDGAPLPDVPTGDVIVGSGGLYSTGNDLLRWLDWHLSDEELNREARFLTHGIYVQREGMTTVHSVDESGRMDAMGLGWVAMNATAERPFILQKSGALQGQMSYIAMAPERGTGVFITMNQFNFAAAYQMAETANQLLIEISQD
ncbi:MAG: D-alanyl-D-alanine-carboxypeptidase/endopeptidase AmpH [Hyphomonas sp.]|nr:D-alanyl-D-alanine-carboxypeptidase/endopeptidase AmpH [Hyphomonas sp.]|tara:strand:- start:73 stop:1305 length:1233 start_codon:yes stop_codon:yes gene_type:complete